MRLSDIQAQETAVRALRSSLKTSSVAHAYLFTGPASCGKTSAALAFAAALNCAEPSDDGDACGNCVSCLRIQAGNDADVELISPQKNQTTIDQMRTMIRDLNFAPISGKYRVMIIEQADTLNPSSENCILKVLEEPPPYAVLILVSRNPNSLLPTIRSRCRTVRFRRASTQEVEEALRTADLTEEDRRVIAACSRGAIGRAFAMASDDRFVSERKSVLEALKSWAEGDPVLAMRTAETLRKMAEPKKNDPDERTRARRLAEYLDHILSWYADLLSLKVNEEAPCMNPDYAAELRLQTSRYSSRRLASALRSVMKTQRYIEGNVTPQLALENMFFELIPDLG